MIDSPLNRIPVEVWERILRNVISVDFALVFATSCSADDYLTFKRTCGDGVNEAYRYVYQVVEKDRKSLRCVCRTWKSFVDRRGRGARWIRTSSLWRARDDEKWRGVMRLDHTGSGATGRFMSRSGDRVGAASVWSQWRDLGTKGGIAPHLMRLELLHIDPGFFLNIMQALCVVGPILQNLRSLALAVGREQYPIMDRLTSYLPELTHLTLMMHPNALWEPSSTPVGPHGLKKLEILFIYPSRVMFDLSNWKLPTLRHIYIRPIDAFVNEVYAFIKRHARTIETVDLENNEQITLAGTRPPPEVKTLTLPAEFWSRFVRLKTLRCSWRRTKLELLPSPLHPLTCLVVTDAIDHPYQFVDLLKAWVADRDVKRLGSIVMYGKYLSMGFPGLRDDWVAQGLLEELRGDRTRLLSPAGKSWLNEFIYLD